LGIAALEDKIVPQPVVTIPTAPTKSSLFFNELQKT
jgi:hypothetical protein